MSDDLHHSSFFLTYEAENHPLKCLDKSKDLESKAQSIFSSSEQENTTELRNRISTYQVATGDFFYYTVGLACVKQEWHLTSERHVNKPLFCVVRDLINYIL